MAEEERQWLTAGKGEQLEEDEAELKDEYSAEETPAELKVEGSAEETTLAVE